MAANSSRGLLAGLVLLAAAHLVAAQNNPLSGKVAFDVTACSVRFPALWGQVSNPDGTAKTGNGKGPLFTDQYAAASINGRTYLKCSHKPPPKPDYDYGYDGGYSKGGYSKGGYRRSLLGATGTAGAAPPPAAAPAAAAAAPAAPPAAAEPAPAAQAAASPSQDASAITEERIEELVAEALAKNGQRPPKDYDAVCIWDGTTDTRVLYDPFGKSSKNDDNFNRWLAHIKWTCYFVSDDACHCNKQIKKDTVISGQGYVQIGYTPAPNNTKIATIDQPVGAKFSVNDAPPDKAWGKSSHIVTGFDNGDAQPDEVFKPLRRFNVGLAGLKLQECANANWQRMDDAGNTNANVPVTNPPWANDVFYNALADSQNSGSGTWTYDLTI